MMFHLFNYSIHIEKKQNNEMNLSKEINYKKVIEELEKNQYKSLYESGLYHQLMR